MKFISDFNRALSMWFNEHGVTNLEFVEGEDFCYYHGLHVVQWGMFDSGIIDNHFQQFFYEYGLNYDDVSVFFLSLLHEVGHYMTLHYFSDDLRANDIAAKECKLADGTIETSYWYWELPTEFAANEWAINWMNDNEDLFQDLYYLCMRHLEQIFNNENILQQLVDWQEGTKNGEYAPLCINEED